MATPGVLSIDLPKLYYTAGEVVTGKIVYNPKSDRNIHGIHIHFTGYEFCENNMLSDIPFQKKWILDGSTTVFGNKCVINRGGHQTHTHKFTEAEGITIKAGNYSWPFSFQIPKNIPPSAEYRAGKVKIDYSIAALVDIPWAKSIRCVQHLRVGLPFVIDPDRPPNVIKNEKSFLLHTHQNTPAPGKHVLQMEAYVDKPVTYTGDKITIFLKVNNNSGRNVQSIKVKLKQTWSYGTGYFEKFTLTKVKHKDRKFPLAEGEYKTEVPMVVPNCDLRPTIQNASLIRCGYHITVIGSIRGGLDLRVRIPIIMASYPPINKALASTPKDARKEKKSEEKEEVPKVEPILIDWDAPAPGQQPTELPSPLLPNVSAVAPLQPTVQDPNRQQPFLDTSDFFVDSSVPSGFNAFEEVRPSPQVLNELELNSRVSEINETVNDLDSATQWAVSGQLEHAVEVDPSMTAERAQAAILAAAKNLIEAISKLVEAAKKQSPQEYIFAVKDAATKISQLASGAKTAAYQLGDPRVQQGLLQGTKAIALGTEQLFLQGKEIVNYDPFTSTYSQEFMVQTMETTAKNVQDNCVYLANYTQQAYAAAFAGVNQLVEARTNVDKSLSTFVNPFGEANENATAEEVERFTQQFAAVTSQFIVACHGSGQEMIQGGQALTASIQQLLLNVKGLAKKTPTIGQQLMENAKAAAAATQRLLDLAAIAIQQGNVTNPQNVERDINSSAKENHQKSSNIISLLRAENQRRNLEMQEESKRKEVEEKAIREAEAREKEKADFEDRAEQELIKAAQAIAIAAEKLKQAVMIEDTRVQDHFGAHRVDHRHEVIDASSSVAMAISELLRAASLAQAERAKSARDARPDTPYHKDPVWTEGLISAARNVVTLIEQLVAATQGELDEEVIVSLARAITAATAQLMSAERAKGDPDSAAHKMLNAAAKVVARTTTELVQRMKDATEHKLEPGIESKEESKADESATATRAKELEAAIKIAKLEKELEKARIDMLKMRQDKYKG